jgi:hypothetical protein
MDIRSMNFFVRASGHRPLCSGMGQGASENEIRWARRQSVDSGRIEYSFCADRGGNGVQMGVTAPEVRRAGTAKRERRERYERTEVNKTMTRTMTGRTTNTRILAKKPLLFKLQVYALQASVQPDPK